MADEQAGKIFVDDDWKNQAQAEKAKLAEQEAEQSGAGEGGGQRGLPKADFRGLVGMLASQALMYLGGMADPQSGRAVFDPDYAKHMIDLLAVVEEKSKGNLDAEEEQELGTVIRELRARFVELMQLVAQQQAQGGAAPPTDPPSSGGSAGGPGIITP